MKRFLLISLLTMIMAAGVSFTSDIPTVSAYAFASCGQDQCNGQDPSKLGCVPSAILRWYQYIYNPQDPSIALGRVEQWYSPTCNAIWTNVQTLNNAKYGLDAGTTRSIDYKTVGYSNINSFRQNAHTPMLGFWAGTCYSSAADIILPSGVEGHASFVHCYQS